MAHADRAGSPSGTCSSSAPPRPTSAGTRYRRVPGDTMAQGTLLRIATCFSGQVEVQANCLPLFDYGVNRRRVDLRRRRLRRADRASGDLTLDLTGEHAPRDPRAPAPTGARRSSRARPRGSRCRGTATTPTLRGRGDGAARRHREVLARLAEPGDDPRPPVASVHRAQRARAQGAELRTDRRDHGRRHDVAARDARRRAQLGLPLHVDPRHRVHAAGAARPRLRVGGVRVLRVPARDGRGERQAAAPGHSRSCTASAARPTSPSTRSTTSPATATRGRCASATARTTSTSTTCGGCCSTRWRSTQRAGRPDPAPPSGRPSRSSSTRPSSGSASPTRASGRCAATRSTSSRRR